MVTRRGAESPSAYSVDVGTESWLVKQDGDIEFQIVAVGDTNYQIEAVDSSGDLGIVDWKYSIQLKESQSLA